MCLMVDMGLEMEIPSPGPFRKAQWGRVPLSRMGPQKILGSNKLHLVQIPAIFRFIAVSHEQELVYHKEKKTI